MTAPTPNTSVIGLDYGSGRIGVAIASQAARLPVPKGAIAHSPTMFEDIRVMAEDSNTAAFVVGLPRGLEGQETSQTADARHFAHELGSRLGLPVHLQDEAVTSKQAEAELKHRGVQYNKADVDALAAVYILEDFLRESFAAHKL